MITYTLAKELKDNGFKFARCECVDSFDSSNLGTCAYCGHAGIIIENKHYILPTLSELIEACWKEGRHFNLYRRSDERWEASSIELSLKTLDNTTITEYGKTAFEAVTRLWLALNKK